MRVVNVRTEVCTHYIGRGRPVGNAVNANLGNPYVIGLGDDREQAIAEFEAWARSQPAVMERIRALPKDAVLGCWCKPLACHGDVIIKLWKEMHDESDT
jgi:hypothetical protein